MQNTQFPHYPRIHAKAFVDWNEEMFVKYNNERVYEHVNPIIRFIERKRVAKVIEFLGTLKKTDYILAAGCGEGYIERQIPKAQLLLVDISKEALKRARASLSDKKRYSFLNANLENLPVRATIFDKIECSEVIEHVLSPKKVFAEFHRVLKTNGILVISFPNEPLINLTKKILIKLGLFYFFFPNIPKDMTEEWHLRSYSLDEFGNDIKTTWSIERQVGIPFKFFPIRYVVQCKKL